MEFEEYKDSQVQVLEAEQATYGFAVKHVDFGSLKALVTVSVGPLEIRGFKVIDDGRGFPWVSSPSREIFRGGKKEYYEIVRFTSPEDKGAFDTALLKAYHAKE